MTPLKLKRSKKPAQRRASEQGIESMGQVRVFLPLDRLAVALVGQVLAQRRADGPAALPGGKGTQPADQSIVVARSEAELRAQADLRPQADLRAQGYLRTQAELRARARLRMELCWCTHRPLSLTRRSRGPGRRMVKP